MNDICYHVMLHSLKLLKYAHEALGLNIHFIMHSAQQDRLAQPYANAVFENRNDSLLYALQQILTTLASNE